MNMFTFEGQGFFDPIKESSVFICAADDKEKAKEKMRNYVVSFAKENRREWTTDKTIQNWVDTFRLIEYDEDEVTHFDPRVSYE